MLNTILVFLHIIAVLIWIGGMLYTLFVLRPSLSILDDKKPVFMKSIMDRFFPLVWVSILILLITGGIKAHVFVSYPLFLLKLILYVIMVINFTYIYFGLYKKLPISDNKPAVMEKITFLIKINFSLGIIIMLLILAVKY